MNHPALTLIIGIFVLIVSYKSDRIFKVVAILTPIATLFSIFIAPSYITLELFKGIIICDGSIHNNLIGSAFCAVLFAGNLYAIGQKKQFELITGNFYGASTLICLFAGDFISMYIGLEMMMLFSTAIIFKGGSSTSIRSAKKYFLTHLTSSSLILLGIIHIVSISKSLALINITALLGDAQYSHIVISLMLLGMLINIAAMPFSGWMANYYLEASSSGFIYLISFTTKVSVILLLKLFASFYVLKYIGAAMIFYAMYKAIFEKNIFKTLCYLSIMSMGLMIMGISIGSREAVAAVICYLFIHILYKLVLTVCASCIADNAGIYNWSDLGKINSRVIIIASSIGVVMMIALPINIASLAYQIKLMVAGLLQNEIFYILPPLVTFATVYLLPWSSLFSKHEMPTITLGNYTKASLAFITILLIIINLYGLELISLVNSTSQTPVSIFSTDCLKQIFIIFLGIYLSIQYKIKKIHTESLNLIEQLGIIFSKYYIIWTKNKKAENCESYAFLSLEYQIINKLAAIHNQKTAVFIIFTFFLTILFVLYLNILI